MGIAVIYDFLSIHQFKKFYFAESAVNMLFSNGAFILNLRNHLNREKCFI